MRYIPQKAKYAVISKTMMKGIMPNLETRIGKFRHPVPKADASIAKIDPLIVPFRTYSV
jgi:hypothetical protein